MADDNNKDDLKKNSSSSSHETSRTKKSIIQKSSSSSEKASPSKEDKKHTSIDAIINSDMIYYERLPMLEVVLDRLVRILSKNLQEFTSADVEISLDSITTLRFGDYINALPTSTMLSVFRAEQWDNQGLLIIDNQMIYSAIDALLGSHRSSDTQLDNRFYTTIECNLVQRMMKVILNDFSLAFEPVSNVNFKFERLETDPRTSMIAQPANSAILIKIHVEIEGRAGKIDILLPYVTIEPVRALLLQNFMGEKFGRDSIWENHLSQQLWKTDITLEVILKPENMTLQEVLGWDVGTQILLQSTLDSTVHLNCGRQSLFAGKVRQKSGKVAIKVEKVLFGEEERGEINE
jgi:flagellar motor switch protein FliM